MAIYQDLINDDADKFAAATKSDAAILADQARLSADQADNVNLHQAAGASRDALTRAVALQTDGVRDPATGIHYLVIGGQLHLLKPTDASSTVPAPENVGPGATTRTPTPQNNPAAAHPHEKLLSYRTSQR